MSEATHNSSTSPPQAPSMTTESFQKYYGRGYAAGAKSDGYPNPPHPGAEQRHPPMDNYQHPHFAPPPNEPPSRGAPHHGYAHAPSSSWYYNQQQQHQVPPPPPPQQQFPSPHNHHDASSSKRRHAPLLQQSPPMVTPKESNDSDSAPNNLPTQAAAATRKKSTRSSTKQQQSRKNIHAPTINSSSAKESAAAAAAEEEIQVDPMKQDFFFYAKDHFDTVKAQCEEECKQSSSQAGNKENELYRLTTLMNARLIQDWESGPASLREQYMKMEDDDRQRFMSEEEVASRHCATLTARKRSPKQQNIAGKAPTNARKSSNGDSMDGMVTESKRARV
mmetsp:Transcript_29575/g.59439  ORF Transcript_29575/g.59439 Transcript_29575/m.59439 type:complete len:334 (+) Transcript_29575:169-1170(+)